MTADRVNSPNEMGERCPFASGAARGAYADQSHGVPRVDFSPGDTPYVAYAQIGTLLSLQHPRTNAPTEPGFIILSQVKELLFKLLHIELTAVCDLLRADRLEEALWTFRRSTRVQRYLIQAWDVVGAMTTVEFLEFRDELGEASGFQSFSYRKLEFLLGNKNADRVAQHRNSPAYESVLEQLHLPSLYDVALAFLNRHGLDLPREVLEHDPTVPREPHPAVEAAWARVYSQPSFFWDAYKLAEALLETDELFVRWRQVHLVTVHRIIGDKPGTGGTYGVEWLRRISERRFFPELWKVRSKE
jgi:tryptophan 2,3-dioxygenase